MKSAAIKALKYGILPGVFITLLLFKILSLSAAWLFNYAMEQQEMLQGTITVEEIRSDSFGHVNFKNLEWKSPEGYTLLLIPDGDFAVRLWDVLTFNFKSTTIQELTLNNAMISLHLTDDMKLDVVRPSPEMADVTKTLAARKKGWEGVASLEEPKTEAEKKQLAKKKRILQEMQMRKEWQNFNQDEEKIKLKLNLNKCGLEIFYRQRHYLLSSVHLMADIDTDRLATIKAHTGPFGGTMVGDGMAYHGSVDFTKEPIPECSISIMLSNVIPASLGFGLNVTDRMTLATHFSGPISGPIGTGKVVMERLSLPGLRFDEVEGDILYEDAILNFQDVKAKVYGGMLVATGTYDFDTRRYTIEGRGENLQAAKALPQSDLNCSVNLDLYLSSDGHPENMEVRGDFSSGPGRYQWIPFDSLRGSFLSRYHNLQFTDVAVAFGTYRIVTDAFSIVDKKLRLNPIKLVDSQNNTVLTCEPKDAYRKETRVY